MTTDNPVKLSTRDFNLWFANKHALKNINIAFQANAVTALIGPSGCGKSTLLRSFNRMHDLTPNVRMSGQVFLDVQDLYAPNVSVPQLRRRIGMVFQKANPFPKSIYENINYGLAINNYPKQERAYIIEQALKESFLWEEVSRELDKPATRLSGGQQQRLCIARTVALRPEVILMDEPCSALDPISTQKIEDLIVKLKNNYTIVIVTHNMQQAQRIADNTVFMYMGEVIETNRTEAIFKAPQEELTKKYIGGSFG